MLVEVYAAFQTLLAQAKKQSLNDTLNKEPKVNEIS
jgi:hypothetical protein